MNTDQTPPDTDAESTFWRKLRAFAVHAGHDVIEKALWLYYAAQKPEVPAKAKAAIWAALGYLILPLDAVADVIPVVGFGDDLAVLAASLATVARHVDAEVKAKASATLRGWLNATTMSG
ncbi:MAG: DUF1232 domain-containing protein [Thiohalocapsa sp.]|nr:DUF1232 domain-containing protein [Thiohalocapsa sp.]